MTGLYDRQSSRLTIVGLCGVGLAYPLQQALIIPALPALARDLHTSVGWSTWILTIFLLSAAVSAPLVGRLGDQFGKKRMLVASTVLVLGGAIGATFAWNIWSLIVFRAVAGLGGATTALSLSILRDEFPRAKLSHAIGLVTGVFGLGGAIGIGSAGLVIDQLSWRWLFGIGGVAIGVAGGLVAWLVPESPQRAPARLDIPGAALFAGGVLCLLVGLTEVQRWGLASGRILGLLVAGFVLLVVWGRAEARSETPMIDVRLLARRPVVLTHLATLLGGFALFGIFVLVPHFVEAPYGLSAQEARLVDYGFGASSSQVGIYLAPAVFVQFFAGPVAGLLGARLGSKWPFALGLGLEACGAAALARWHAVPAEVIAGMFVVGTGFGLLAASAPRLVADAVAPTETGVVTGMNSLALSFGGVAAGQLVAVLLASDTIGVSAVPTESAFTLTFSTASLVALAGMALALLIRRPRGMPRPNACACRIA